jgi:hypothetical protein
MAWPLRIQYSGVIYYVNRTHAKWRLICNFAVLSGHAQHRNIHQSSRARIAPRSSLLLSGGVVAVAGESGGYEVASGRFWTQRAL